MNSAALLARLNFSLALTRNRVPGIQVDTARLSSSDRNDIGKLARMLLMREPSSQTVAAIQQAVQAEKLHTPEEESQYLAGLVVGSPDFQRH